MSAVLSIVEPGTEAPAVDELTAWIQELEETLPPVMSPRTLGEVAEVSLPTLTRWRKTWPNGECLGPAFSTPAGTNMVRYFRGDVARWMADSHVSRGAR